MKIYLLALFTVLTTISKQPEEIKAVSPQALNFIIHSITADLPIGTAEFKATYGVGFVVENCALDPISYKRATENNQMIALYLDEKFGDTWWADLPVKPFGL